MAAGVRVLRITGTAGSVTIDGIGAAANTVANATDTHQATAVGSNFPIKVPTGADKYSYWVNTALQMTSLGGSTAIQNIKWWTSVSDDFGTGISTVAATVGSGNTHGYTQATGVEGDSGDELTTAAYTNGDLKPFNGTDPFVIYQDEASALLVSGTLYQAGWFTGIVVYQLVVDNTAGAGTTAPETFTWQYDEV